MRAILWFTPAIVLGVAAWLIFRSVNVTASGLTNRLVEWSIVLAGLPVAASAIVTALLSLRWLLLTFWPATVGVEVDKDALHGRWGPFGSRRFDARRLRIRYPFELIGRDDEDAGFEAYLPEEEQVARLLPRITHPDAHEPLNKTMLKFLAASEADAAGALQPALAYWRSLDPQLTLATDNSDEL